MARKKLIRSLPALRKRRVFSNAHRKTDLLYTILRNAALKYQSEETKTIYPLREVAARYGVSISMVSAAYQRLEKRSEEHTSELQSLRHLVCRLLLEK